MMANFEMPKTKTSCLSCKLTSVCCLLGVGAYLIRTAKFNKGNGRLVTALLGTGTICLGVGEIFDKSPFRDY